MINPASAINPTIVAYSGGVASTAQPGFSATLAAKIAEFQTVKLEAPSLNRHHIDDFRNKNALNQDVGNQKQQDGAGGSAAAIAG